MIATNIMDRERILKVLADLINEIESADNWEDAGISRHNWSVRAAKELLKELAEETQPTR